ncbi:hypothetical protein [Nubsella zeaxanthinifaciens]|uniref:hypothetical protein n=1 Tax=Nubsella zeaxanthinifaciens TaxID=392412 RepID=UPI000DE48A5A|nr:hypothetical protein [Nubsella zeaxanthinifaciens]
MKQVLFILLTALTFSAYAQEWSATDQKVYGNQTEYKAQMELAKKSKHRNLYRLVGFTPYYANGLSLWMQDRGFTSQSLEAPANQEVYLFAKNYVGSVKPTDVKLVLNLQNSRVANAKIYGSFSDLAQLFLYYWPTSADYADSSKLKQGTIAQKQVVDEIVRFNYSQKEPFIEVLKI